MAEETCFYHVDASGIAVLTLNRPELHNALDESLVCSLFAQLREIEENRQVRAVILTAAGKNFCAGADLNWMRNSVENSTLDNTQIGQKLAELMWKLHNLSKPTIALIKGVAFGGGAGLVSCCDIALADPQSRFCFSEVRLGLIPSVISPYIVRAIGERVARRYFLTAEQFSAEDAYRIGLIHEIVDSENQIAFAHNLADSLIAGGPCALTRTKELLDTVSSSPLDRNTMLKTAEWITEVLKTPEAQEGIKAYLQKRKASWLKDRADCP